MARRNTLFFVLLLILFALSLAVVFPVNEGLLGKRGIKLGLDLKGGIHLVYQADLSSVEPGKGAEAIDGAIAVIEKRVNALGVSEPLIQKQGNDRILVELPGISEVEEAKALIGRTAILEFGELAAEDEPVRWTNDLGKWKPATAEVNGQVKELTSAYFKTNTYVTRDELSKILLVFEWNDEGSKLSEQITGRLIGKRLGIFLGDESLKGEDGQPIAPIVRSQIVATGQIDGLSYNEALELSRLLNAGRIPVPLTTEYEQSVSPILGTNFVDLSVRAGVIGLVLVMLFMIAYYRFPGVLASLALFFYAALVLAIFKLIPVTLTLAGIGGFIVSIGMAVDANVLIFERMKEEFAAGRTFGATVEAGFDRAWSAIRDSNVTTFIACAILYWLGSSVAASAPVMSFALTLFIGVAASMFTAVTAMRVLLRLFIGSTLQHTWLFKIDS